MILPFFRLAAVSPGRQRSFRQLVAAHLLGMAGAVLAMHFSARIAPAALFGSVLLVAGIVEGALLIGWRLTQLPKSQSLETLLASPLRPPQVFAAEFLVGLGRLAVVTLAGLPVLILLALEGVILSIDIPTLLIMPSTWGAVTGLGLTVWGYEPLAVRRWGERVILFLVVVYLVVGILIGEHLFQWLDVLPPEMARQALLAVESLHRNNPFTVMKDAMEQDPRRLWATIVMLQTCGMVLIVTLGLRAAYRLQGHFHDRHYRPAVDESGGRRGIIGERPLAWWCVRRVTEYSGRINLWLAGGFGILYAVYVLLGDDWPPWLGHSVFQVFDRLGGIPVIATGLVVLSAVPAAFQYGLWDSNTQDRCRRLELLLLTRLDAGDYWGAATAAAWRRGRGYFAVAAILWVAGWLSGHASPAQLAAAMCAAVILWALYFALGFRAFCRGMQASALGLFLTIGLPLLAAALYQIGAPALAVLLPPGAVYQSSSDQPSWIWLLGPITSAMLALAITRWDIAHCLRDLRRWYDLHHGQKVLE